MAVGELKSGGTCACRAKLKTRVLGGGLRGVILIHARKAGGTTLRGWLTAASQLPEWKLGELMVTEGKCWRPELITALQNDGWIFVTSIRDPIRRAVSAFDYEGRWGGITKVHLEDRSLENSKSIGFWSVQNRDGSWGCSSECFLKWLGGIHNPKWDGRTADQGPPAIFRSVS